MTSWTVAHQASLAMKFFRQEYGCQFLPQGINPMEGSNSHLLSPARAGRFFTTTAREAPFFPSPNHSYTSRSKITYPGCKFAHKRNMCQKDFLPLLHFDPQPAAILDTRDKSLKFIPASCPRLSLVAGTLLAV